ncbi:MAG: hypothetical protein IPJ34_15755 [Myxococcales bacterium]|nr:hypothetical protein [Myxococcales bacterium]
MRRELGVLVACMALASCKRSRPLGPDATLTFTKDGATVRALPLSELAKAIPPETVSGFDPYHRKPKRFRALP